MNFLMVDGSHIVRHMPNIKEYFSVIDEPCGIQNNNVVWPCRKHLLVTRWFNKLRWRLPPTNLTVYRTPFNSYLLCKHDGIHQSIPYTLWLHLAVIFWVLSDVSIFPKLETKCNYNKNYLCRRPQHYLCKPKVLLPTKKNAMETLNRYSL